MNIFKSLFTKTVETDGLVELKDIETKSADLTVQNVPPSFLFNTLFSNGTVTTNQAFKYYRENSAVAIAVDEIASAVEEIHPVLKIDNEYITDHDIIKLILNPNGHDEYKQFIGNLIRHYLLTHNSYLLALGNYKFPPLELYPIHPSNISIYPSTDGYVGQYYMSNTVSDGEYHREIERGKITKFVNSTKLSELYHIMGFSSDPHNTQGDSPLTAILGDIQHIIKGNEHNISLLDGVTAGLWIDYGDAPAEEELAARRQHIMENLSGPENAGKPYVTGSDGTEGKTGRTSIVNLSTNNKDMDFSELNEAAKLIVFLRYGIPLPLVTVAASSYNNIASSILYFYEKTVIPNINTILSGMSKFLIPKYRELDGSDAIITFNPNDIPVLMSKKFEEIKMRKETNIETVNELRELMPDRDPVEGGDDIFIMGSMRGLNEEEEEPVTEESIRADLGLQDASETPGASKIENMGKV